MRPEFTVRIRCEAGCVAFRDNRAVARLALRGIFDSDFDRLYDGVTLTGDIPVGVGGRASTAIDGNPIRASAASEVAKGAR